METLSYTQMAIISILCPLIFAGVVLYVGWTDSDEEEFETA